MKSSVPVSGPIFTDGNVNGRMKKGNGDFMGKFGDMEGPFQEGKPFAVAPLKRRQSPDSWKKIDFPMYKKTKNLHHYRQFVLDSLTSDFFWNIVSMAGIKFFFCLLAVSFAVFFNVEANNKERSAVSVRTVPLKKNINTFKDWTCGEPQPRVVHISMSI